MPTYLNAVAVTPNNGTDLPKRALALYAGVSGNIAVITAKGQTTTIPAIAGMPIPVVVTRVLVTGTTATGIIALY
jgi:hypothetical protein